MERSSKVSFKLLRTFRVFRTCIYILVYEIKIVTNILMGFKIWCQVGGGGTKFQNYTRYVTFLFLVPNLSFFTHDYKKNLNLMSSWGWESKFSIFWGGGGHTIWVLVGVSSFSEKVGGINFEFWWGFYFSTRHPNFTSNRYSVPSGFRADLHARPEGPSFVLELFPTFYNFLQLGPPGLVCKSALNPDGAL